jgi:hypothetical protein
MDLPLCFQILNKKIKLAEYVVFEGIVKLLMEISLMMRSFTLRRLASISG